MNHSYDIGSLIKSINVQKDSKENRMLKEYGITTFQMHILVYLNEKEDKAASLKELEKAMMVSQSTIAKVIKSMVREKALLQYLPDETDKRIKKVCLLENAHLLCQQTEGIVEEMEKKMTEGFTEKEISTLKELLLRVNNSLKEEAQQ